MKIHKEGYSSLIVILITVLLLLVAEQWFLPDMAWLQIITAIVGGVLFLIVLQFFRSPKRKLVSKKDAVICPADGKVVVIEETMESEYFNDRRLQISIFMSPTNVHINRYPVDGVVKYTRYHPGEHMVAWHPKSSELNEQNTVVLEQDNGVQVLMRQIAGFVARRIVWYCEPGDQVTQGTELGFIKFGSRVDLFLPLNTTVRVDLDQKVRGGTTIIAELA